MLRRAAIIFAAAVLLAVAIATLLLFRNDEPGYKGRPLSDWIWTNRQNPDDPEAREAIVVITTNSVPVLIRWLGRDTRFEENLERKLPSFMRTNNLISRYMSRGRYRTACSAKAFKISGTNATCAIPPLTKLLAHTNSTTVKVHATMALSCIGPAALTSLRQAAMNPDSLVRGLAVVGLRRLGTNAIPDLIAALSDPEPSVRHQATNALEQISPEALPLSPLQ
jgi:hypothetical protein